MADEYDVGYGRPPKHGQFQKGQSGNPTGRRAEQDKFASVLRDELANEIVMKIGDKKVKATVMRGLTKLLINMALSGDKKAITELMRQINRYFPASAEPADTDLPAAEEDLNILDNYVRRQLARGSSTNEEGDDERDI